MQRDEATLLMTTRKFSKSEPWLAFLSALMMFVMVSWIQPAFSSAQDDSFPLIENNDPIPEAGDEESNRGLGSTLPVVQEQENAQPDATPAAVEAAATGNRKGISFLNLLTRGGWFMLPLGLLSIAVVTIGVERYLALKQDRVFPQQIADQIGDLCKNKGGLDPRRAYQVCQSYPSSASYIIRSALTRVGRPQSEIENSVNESSQREALRLAQPVSWLTLAAGVAPLVGLLGTVWGITQCFFDTTQLPSGQSVRTVFSVGIYTAMVTTMCGLLIAIPAAILAHFYENRIMRLVNEIQEMVVHLLPQFERYEGQMRFATDTSFAEEDEPEHAGSNHETDSDVPVYSAPTPPVPAEEYAPVVNDISESAAIPAAQATTVDQLAIPPLRKTKRKTPKRPR